MRSTSLQTVVEDLLQYSSVGLIRGECSQLRALLSEFQYLFAAKDSECRWANVTKHDIGTGATPLICKRQQLLPLARRTEVEEKIKEMSSAPQKVWGLPQYKCQLFQREMSFLGHVVEGGVATDPAKVEAVRK